MSNSPPPVIKHGVRAKTYLDPGCVGRQHDAKHHVAVDNRSGTSYELDVEGNVDPDGPLLYGPRSKPEATWKPLRRALHKPGFLKNRQPEKFDEEIYIANPAAVRGREESITLSVDVTVVGRQDTGRLGDFSLLIKCH